MAEDPNDVSLTDPIGGREDFQKWLNSRSGNVVDAETKALLLRLAMRLFPLVLQILELDGPEQATKNEKRLVLLSFRALLTTRTALVHSASDVIESLHTFRSAIDKLIFIDQDGVSSVAAQIAADAATCASLQSGQSASARQHKEQFLNAAGFAINQMVHATSNVDAAKKDMFESITADARLLQGGSTAEELLRRRLWLNDVRSHKPKRQAHNLPDWCRTPFDRFEGNQYVKGQPWEKIVHWYRSFLAFDEKKLRDGFGKKVENRIAVLPDEIWNGDPDEAMAKIADVIKRIVPESVNVEVAVGAGKVVAGGLAPEVAAESRRSKFAEAVLTHSDEPTDDDILERRFFARALVERMDDIRSKGGEDGFAVHLYAPWGAGKSSVLKLMDAIMTDKNRPEKDRWIVVKFNAWEHASRRPPWWPFLETLKNDATMRLVRRGYDRRARRLQRHWWVWKVQADWFPVLLAVGAICVVICLWGFSWWFSSEQEGFIARLNEFLGATGRGIATFAAIIGVLAAWNRLRLFGSNKNENYYFDLSRNPLQRIVDLFERLVTMTGQPICIFIDDIDRCSSDYVVDILEGIQTSFRHRNVAYVVAADRTWIKTSFETVLGNFKGVVGDSKQPLGYLFLEKIFQISTALPSVPVPVMKAYWNYLLTGKRPISSIDEVEAEQRYSGGLPAHRDASKGDAKAAIRRFDSAVDARRREVRAQIGEALTREIVEESLEKNDSAIDRVAFALELNRSSAAEAEALHELEPFVTIVSDNPRVMKRMLNAYGLRQNVSVLEGSSIPNKTLARWTTLEQRFPSLADYLIAHPDWITYLTPETDKSKVPDLLAPFLDDAIIGSVVGSGGEDALTETYLREITRGLRG